MLTVRPPCEQVKLMQSELDDNKLIARFKGLEIYQIQAESCPALMREIGRIRKREFGRAGGGTEKKLDIDRFDLHQYCYQLIVWDPQNCELTAMYRYIPLWKIPGGELSECSPSFHLFRPGEQFRSQVQPHTIELGRSVVNRDATRKILGLFAVWRGLGALIRNLPRAQWFFGKLTVYPCMPSELRRRIFGFWDKYCAGDKTLLYPVPEFEQEADQNSFLNYPREMKAYQAFARFSAEISALGHSLPPLMKSYLAVSDGIQSFGTAVNDHFGGVFETAILLPFKSINAKTRKRFIEPYESRNPHLFEF